MVCERVKPTHYTTTNALLYFNSVFFYIQTLKMLLHVSILRSSSGSTFCSLLKLYVKKLIILSNVSVMRQHIVCMCVCCMCCREVGQQSQNSILTWEDEYRLRVFDDRVLRELFRPKKKDVTLGCRKFQ